MTWNGYARWLRDHYVSMPKLIGEHHLGMVIVAANIDYLESFTFFEADLLDVEVSVKLRAGKFLDLEVAFRDNDRTIAQTQLLLYPSCAS